MSILSFYIPFLYSYKSRFKTIFKLLSWIIIYIFPTFYFYIAQKDFVIQEFFSYLWVVSLIYTLYEIGYIQNDCETIKNEESPTLRLSNKGYQYYNQHKIRIYAVRLIWAILFSSLLCYSNHNVEGNIYFLAAAWTLLVIYQIYNRLRSKLNLYLHFVLVSIRYCSVFLLFIPDVNWPLLCVAFLCFPVINFIERASESRFSLKWAKFLISQRSDIPKFRVYYYLVLSISSLFLLYWPIEYYLFIPIWGYLIYRLVIFYIPLKSVHPKYV